MAGIAATYISPTQFSLVGDWTDEFVVVSRVKADCGVDGTFYAETTVSTYNGTITTVTLNAAVLTANLAGVWFAVAGIGPANSLPIDYLNNRYLTISDASSTYLTLTGAASTYLTIANAASTYLTIGGNISDLTNDADYQTGTEVAADIATHTAISSAHHTRYADSEAVAAMGVEGNSNPYNHVRYADSEAVTAMGVEGNSNPLNHARYTDAEASGIGAGLIAIHAALPNVHHAQTHTIASHDTTATGTNLTQLTDGSETALHIHDARYYTETESDAKYLTIANAASTYLTITNAASTYLTIANAASTYLTIATASTTYEALDGSNQPATGNKNIYNAAPESRLTENINDEYTRLIKIDTDNAATRYNRIEYTSSIGAETKLLLHCDGTDGSQVFSDSSSTGHIVTAQSDAQVDTALFKFGTGAGLFAGTGDYLNVPHHTDFNFGTGDFTIEFWIYSGGSSNYWVFNKGAYNATGWNFYYFGGRIGFYAGAPTISILSTTNIKNDGFHHVAAVRNSGTITLYIDGVSEGTPIVSSVDYDNAGDVQIGGSSVFANYSYSHIDEPRISNIAQYTGNFTPQTAQFGSPTYSEIQVWEATDSLIAGEKGILTFGYTDTGLVLNGQTVKFNIDGAQVGEWEADGTLSVNTADYEDLVTSDDDIPNKKYTDDAIDTDIGTHAAISAAHHTRYADSEAVSAMGVLGNGNPLNHDRYTDSEASSVAAGLITTHTSDADAHHAQLHSIASHNDTSATGTQLNTLVGGGDIGNLHLHTAEIAADIATHAALPDVHHAQTHTIVSHDTTATGANLTTLTDGSDTALHNHNTANAALYLKLDTSNGPLTGNLGHTMTEPTYTQTDDTNSYLSIFQRTDEEATWESTQRTDDGNNEFCVLYLNCDTDSWLDTSTGGSTHTFSELGSPVATVVDATWGSALDTTGGAFAIYTAAHADLNLGSGDWLIRWRARRTKTGLERIFGNLGAGGAAAGSNMYAYWNTDTMKFRFYDSADVRYEVEGTTDITDTNWHEYAISCDAGIVYLYTDGDAEDSIDFTGKTFREATNGFYIGTNGIWTGNDADCETDEFAIWKGYTDLRGGLSYTPRTAPYSGYSYDTRDIAGSTFDDGTYFGNSAVENTIYGAQTIFNIGGSECARISSGCNFGLGTTAPAAKFHIDQNDTTVYGLRIDNVPQGGFAINLANTGADTIGTYPIGDMYINNSNYIDRLSSGNILRDWHGDVITGDSYLMSNQLRVYSNSADFVYQASNDTYEWVYRNAASAEYLHIGYTGGAGYMTLDDSAKLHFGTSKDVSTYYDGTDLIIDTDVVGSGSAKINTLEIDKDGFLIPISAADGSAPNSSIYYSTTASKLVYKDSGGTVNNLY